MQYNNVEIYAESILSFKVHDGEMTADAEDLSTVRVIYNEDSGPQLECSGCHRELELSSEGIAIDEDGWLCPDGTPHTPETAPLSWVNSASINPDPDEDSITLTVSVGDPRGAFCMTLRKVGDHILMDVPHPEQPSLHLPLQVLRPGTYRVNA